MPVPSHTQIRAKRLALATLCALLFGALAAQASVRVYSNDFSSRTEFAEIERSRGKACDRRYRKKSKAMLALLKRGPASCAFRPPVVGDAELPNHRVKVDGKVLDTTPKSIRGGAFLELTVRSGGGGAGYSLRIFPEKKRFALTRGPQGGGFPVTGKSNAVKKIGERNRLELAAGGATIRAFVNGQEVAKVEDQNPGQVTGRKIRFALGSEKDGKKDTRGTFKRVSVSVPG